jgi:hypothetical protein
MILIRIITTTLFYALGQIPRNESDYRFIGYKIETAYLWAFTYKMARVFVFSEWCSPTSPSIEDVSALLPPGARIIAYNVNYSQIHNYFMVAFDKSNEIYELWCNNKEADIPIYLENDKWRLRS